MKSTDQVISISGLLGVSNSAASVPSGASQNTPNPLTEKTFSSVLEGQQQAGRVPVTEAGGLLLVGQWSQPLAGGAAEDSAAIGVLADTESGKPLPQSGLTLPPGEGDNPGEAMDFAAGVELILAPETGQTITGEQSDTTPAGTAGTEEDGTGEEILAQLRPDSQGPVTLQGGTTPQVAPADLSQPRGTTAGEVAAPPLNQDVRAGMEIQSQPRHALTGQWQSQQAAHSVTDAANTPNPAAQASTPPTAPTLAALGKQLASAGQTQGVTGKAAKAQIESLALASVTDIDTSLSSATSTHRGDTYSQQPVPATYQTAVPVTVGKPGWSEGVMEKVMWMSAQNVNKAEIQLDPPDLGPLQVRITSQGEHTSIAFSSTHATVRDALDQGLPRLREMMENQGFAQVDVDVSGEGQQYHTQRGDGEGDMEGGRYAASGQPASAEQPGENDTAQLTPVSLNPGLVDQYV